MLLVFVMVAVNLVFWYGFFSVKAADTSFKTDQEVLVRYEASFQTGFLGKIKKYVFEKTHGLDFKGEVGGGWIVYNNTDDLGQLKNETVIEDAQINYHYKAMAAPNDTNLEKLWALGNSGQSVNGTTGSSGSDLDVTEAWDLEKSSWDEAKVAVIDAGFSADYGDISENIDLFHSWDFTSDDFLNIDATDPAGTHGAQIAAIIGSKSNNSAALSGLSVTNRLKLMLLKTDYTTAQLIAAINYAGTNGAKVINASWGCLDDGGASSYSCVDTKDYNDAALQEALGNFSGLVVTAAGNMAQEAGSPANDHDGAGSHVYPCDFGLANIVCVTATDQNDNLASFSDFGSASVDVAAPGTNIYVPDTSTEETILSEDFSQVAPPEIGTKLTKEGTDNYWGTTDMSGTHALWGDYLNTPYLSNQATSVKTETFNLASDVYSTAKVNFNVSCDTEPRNPDYTDYMILSVYDGSAWHELEKLDEDRFGDELFHEVETDLTPYLNSQLQLKFSWITNAINNNHLGCSIWPITVTANKNFGYSYTQGTSYAAAYVSGLTGLMWSFDNDLAVSQVKQAIVATGDEKASLTGKIVSGKRVNYYKALKSLDTVAPSGTLAAAITGGVTTSAIVPLSLAPSDDGFGFAAARFSNNGNNWTDWLDYQEQYLWDITNASYGGNTDYGTKTIYFQLQDVVGNVSAVFNLSVNYTAVPAATISPTSTTIAETATTGSERSSSSKMGPSSSNSQQAANSSESQEAETNQEAESNTESDPVVKPVVTSQETKPEKNNNFVVLYWAIGCLMVGGLSLGLILKHKAAVKSGNLAAVPQ